MPVPKKFSASTASLASPIGGWNARDSLAEMSPLDAVQLVNFFPTPTDVTLRKGYTKYTTGITGNVETLINYSSATVQKLFAIANGVIYDCSTDPATSVFTGLSNSRWQHTNITTDGGSFTIAVNGTDAAMIYDGTQWYKMATTATAQTISTITRGGTGNLTATLTTASAHGLATGNRVTISGATPSEFNGTYRITVTGASTFTYTMATAPSGDATVVGTYTVLGIAGVNSNTLIGINQCQNRLFFVQKNTLTFWYLAVDSISGTATDFNLGGVARSGGYLQAMGTWTIDAGYGVDDLAAFVTSMGEVIVYKGTNPSDANAWSLSGVWQLGQTFSRRCFFKFAGDLLLLTQDGLVPMASALQSSRLDPRVNLTDKIFYAVSQAATTYNTNFGWQINYFASENMLILNIPTNSGKEQYVMHTITKSWARFTGINAFCWEVSGDNHIYFGSNGYVGDLYQSTSDAGNNITAFAQQAYSYFDSRGQQKRFTLVRPIFQTDNGLPTVLCGISTDFETVPLINQITFNPSTLNVGIWDVGVWDQAKWGGQLFVTKFWQGVTGTGFAGSISLNVASQGIEFHWASTDYVMEKRWGAVMLCFDKNLIGQWVANRVNGVFTPENSSCIGLLDKSGTVIAGVWYEGYTKTSIMTHIAIEGQMSKTFLATIFDYPFVQLGVNKLIGPTNSSNEDAIRFNCKLGFTEEARIKDAFPDGDMVLLTLTKDKCRFLGEKYGKKRTVSTATT